MKLVGKTMFVGGLEQARPERPVHFQASVDDDPGKAIQLARKALVILVCLVVQIMARSSA